MLRDRSIICFANNYDFDPTSKHHVMRALSRENDVLWVNWHGSRRPNLGKRDFGTIVEKLSQVRSGLRQARERLWVLTPLVVPLPASPLARRLNRVLLVNQIRNALRQLPRRRRQLWTFAPDVEFLAGAFREEAIVYYCVDEFALFTGYDREAIRSLDARLCRRADLVLTTSQALFESRRPFNPRTVLMRHGVDHAHFARALDPVFSAAEELTHLPRPIIGYYGLLNDWIDYDLLAEAARLRPEWSFVMIGPEQVDVSPCRGLANLHFLGRRPHQDLPAYCKGFDVAIIPRKVNELMKHVNPIKLREYLAAGLPVVSTPSPELQLFADGVYLADDAPEFIRGIERAMRDDSPAARRRRSDGVRSESWEDKIEVISQEVETMLRERRSQRSPPHPNPPPQLRRENSVPLPQGGREERAIVAV